MGCTSSRGRGGCWLWGSSAQLRGHLCEVPTRQSLGNGARWVPLGGAPHRPGRRLWVTQRKRGARGPRGEGDASRVPPSPALAPALSGLGSASSCPFSSWEAPKSLQSVSASLHSQPEMTAGDGIMDQGAGPDFVRPWAASPRGGGTSRDWPPRAQGSSPAHAVTEDPVPLFSPSVIAPWVPVSPPHAGEGDTVGGALSGAWGGGHWPLPGPLPLPP